MVGDIEEAAIPELKRQGLIVQELKSAPPPSGRPLLDDWKRKLGAYKIRLQPSYMPQIETKPFVTQIHLIQPAESAPEFITRPAPVPSPAPGEPSLAKGASDASVPPATVPTLAPRIMRTFDARLHRAQLVGHDEYREIAGLEISSST